jgi:DNA repair exonuclease SbcCD ATPase subunit
MGGEEMRYPEAARIAELEQHAADLKQELADARAEIEKLQIEAGDLIKEGCLQRHTIGEQEAEIECKDKLIEQMREALRLADDLIDDYVAVCEHPDNVDEVRDIIKAALSAAERGGK